MKNTDCLRGFRTLPISTTRAGKPRRCGIEIEFSGLNEDASARLVASVLGGLVTRQAPHLFTIETSAMGTICVELDTRYAKPGNEFVPETVLDAARVIVPVEIITPPLLPEHMDRVIELTDELSHVGAKGTSDSLFAGFGIHFNPEITGYDDPYLMRTVIAFGLLESWLRQWRPLDISRRILPFVDPWPVHFIDALVLADEPDLVALRQLVHSQLNGRNYGLDLLPILHAHDPDAFAAIFGSEASGARPAFHFRMPDCRLDEPGWSIADEWDRWWLVEALAADETRFDALRSAWAAGAGHSGLWIDVVSQHIGREGEALFQ
ncbi:amidoligase family protein [Mameliella alba]|nr:amidoligase family protein [Mameliella alba]MBY6170836.1 amidoligase family protein [Mameliella alba]MBY6175849.1 amidoligase family protein [Mameliella alba]